MSMNYLAEIKERLLNACSPATFQEIGDALLFAMHPDWQIHEFGMKAGTAKTTKGIPDTYFVVPGNRYALVAYTTQKQGLYHKLEKDVSDCLNPAKTHIPKSKIDRVILCHLSGDLNAGQDSALRELCSFEDEVNHVHYTIPLELYGIDQISNCLYTRFPSIASDFLDVSVDSGQIMSAERFVQTYDRFSLAAPLNTNFLFRAEEIEKIKRGLKKHHILILYGASGIGKTRLALEASRRFAVENECQLFCIRSTHQPVYFDFQRILKSGQNCLFLIDDANDVSDLRSILDQVITDPKNENVYVLLTIRDYLKEELENIFHGRFTISSFRIGEFTTQEIEDLVRDNLKIIDQYELDRIARIARGNARIAYMAGKLSDESKLYQCDSIIEIFDQYYKQTISSLEMSACKDRREQQELEISAGILAVFRAIDTGSMEELKPIFNQGIIAECDFKQSLQILCDYELAEIHESVIIMKDPCISSYILYYVFPKKQLLSLALVLELEFRYFRDKCGQAVFTLYNLFNSNRVAQYVEKEVNAAWDLIGRRGDRIALSAFQLLFHVFKPEESMQFVKQEIDELPDEELPEHIDFEHDRIFGKGLTRGNKVLQMLSGYQYNDLYIDTALDLAFSYAKKSKDNLLEFYQWMDSSFSISHAIKLYGFYAQRKAAHFLKVHCCDHIAVSELCFALIRKWLDYEFHFVEPVDGEEFRFGTLSVSASEDFCNYRLILLRIIDKLSMNEVFYWETINLFLQYAMQIRRGMEQNIFYQERDIISNIIRHLQDSLPKAILVDALYRSCKARNIQKPWNLETEALFQGESWKIYHFICMAEKDVYCNGEDCKQQGLRLTENLINLLHNCEVCNFIHAFNEVSHCVNTIHGGEISNVLYLDGILERMMNSLTSVPNLSRELVGAVRKYGTYIDVMPYRLFKYWARNDLQWLYQEIWSEAYANPSLTYSWRYLYFLVLPSDKINNDSCGQLLQFLAEDVQQPDDTRDERSFRVLQSYSNERKGIINDAVRTIWTNKSSGNTASLYLRSLFEGNYFTPQTLLDWFSIDVTLLRNIYFYSLSIYHSADYGGQYLKKFIEDDPVWISWYAEYLLDERAHVDEGYERERVNTLWLMEDAENIFCSIFRVAIQLAQRPFNFRIAFRLKSLFGHFHDRHDIALKQRSWIMKLVDEYALTENIYYVFFMSESLNDTFRKDMVAAFIRNNSNLAAFRRLPLHPTLMSATGSIIPADQAVQRFWKSLLDLFHGARFMNHRQYIIERIQEIDAEIYREQTNEIIEEARR